MARTSGPASVTSLTRTREEALALLDEVRRYLDRHRKGSDTPLPAALRLVGACETMRLTARLTQIVAWLTVRHAAQEGGLGRDSEAASLRLGARDVCGAATPSPLVLAPALLDLLERSSRLYQRVARLDDLLGESPGRA
jgi:regulator of CtrA degradation